MLDVARYIVYQKKIPFHKEMLNQNIGIEGNMHLAAYTPAYTHCL